MDEIRALSDWDLNMALAHFVDLGEVKTFRSPDGLEIACGDYGFFNPCQDRNHAQLVLEKIENELSIYDFLCSLFPNRKLGDHDFYEVWGDLMRTPRELCEAALFVVRYAEDGK
jgi:hypothetical protein